jgi:hypothetical protein
LYPRGCIVAGRTWFAGHGLTIKTVADAAFFASFVALLFSTMLFRAKNCTGSRPVTPFNRYKNNSCSRPILLGKTVFSLEE